jgi:hypothetical protein
VSGSRGARAWRWVLCASAAAFVVGGTACSEQGEATPEARATDVPRTATPQPTMTPVPGDRARVTAAAEKTLDGVLRSPLTPEGCERQNPEQRVCFEPVSGEETMKRGLARMKKGVPGGGVGSAFFGRTADAEWAFWFGTQQAAYVLDELPGELRACPDVDAVLVRTRPAGDAPEAGVVPAGTVIRAEDFVLTEPGRVDGEPGEGWYRVSGGVAGWIEARQSADAESGDCELRDAFERTGTHG